MRVGLTFDLRSDYLARGFTDDETAEFDKAETVAAIDAALRQMSFATDRIGNLAALAERLVAGDRWDFVFNIAEGLRGFGREAQVPALLEAYGIPFAFSDSLVSALSLHKAMTKRVLRDAGVPTADFALVESRGDVAGIAIPFPLFAKPVAEGSSKGIGDGSIVRTRAELDSRAADLLARFKQPVLVETYLPGREFTVGIIGTGSGADIIGVMAITVPGSGTYSFVCKQTDERVADGLVSDPAARQAGAVALKAWRVIGGRDAGRIDVKLDAAGKPNVIEINVLPGLEPYRSDLVHCAAYAGWSYDDLLRRIVFSALHRYRLRVPW